MSEGKFRIEDRVTSSVSFAAAMNYSRGDL
jgi:hypothetical protein